MAGATNAGGFLAVQQYTSHMTGIVSSMAEAAIGGDWFLLSTGGVALAAFLTGAATTAILVNAARQHNLSSAYALPLLLEAQLLLLFGTIGARMKEMHELFVPLTVLLLLFSGFFSGSVVSAAGFRAIGFAATVPLAQVVVALALIPVIDDLRRTA